MKYNLYNELKINKTTYKFLLGFVIWFYIKAVISYRMNVLRISIMYAVYITKKDVYFSSKYVHLM